MAKRFVKYETENPVGVDAEGVLTGDGSGGGSGTTVFDVSYIPQMDQYELIDCTNDDILNACKSSIDVALKITSESGANTWFSVYRLMEYSVNNNAAVFGNIGVNVNNTNNASASAFYVSSEEFTRKDISIK